MTGSGRACPQCGVLPYLPHIAGCDLEHCALCGQQLIGCNCVWELSGIDDIDDQEEIDVPTDAMYEVFDAEVDKYGGRLPWTGEYPGITQCQELGLWCYEDPETHRFVPCDADHPDKREDLTRLYFGRYEWNKRLRRFVDPRKPKTPPIEPKRPDF